MLSPAPRATPGAGVRVCATAPFTPIRTGGLFGHAAPQNRSRRVRDSGQADARPSSSIAPWERFRPNWFWCSGAGTASGAGPGWPWVFPLRRGSEQGDDDGSPQDRKGQSGIVAVARPPRGGFATQVGHGVRTASNTESGAVDLDGAASRVRLGAATRAGPPTKTARRRSPASRPRPRRDTTSGPPPPREPRSRSVASRPATR